jgi:hypothetical protein
MKSLPPNSDLLQVAPNVIWFEPPAKALADPVRFLAYLMTMGPWRILRSCSAISIDDCREALERAPPGIIDARSWACWNVMTGRYPVPPMPRRVIPSLTPCPAFVRPQPRPTSLADKPIDRGWRSRKMAPGRPRGGRRQQQGNSQCAPMTAPELPPKC